LKRRNFLAKIAVAFEPVVSPDSHDLRQGQLARRWLARGTGWSVSDVLCTAGPKDRPFEEQHSAQSLAIVAAGSFQYRSSLGSELMTPGSLMLGNIGQCFECGHEHGIADRCISFSFEPQYLEALAEDSGAPTASFSRLRVPPMRELSPAIARAYAGLFKSGPTGLGPGNLSVHPHKVGKKVLMAPDLEAWEEIWIELAAYALQFRGEVNRTRLPSAEARVTRIIRMIESRPNAAHDLAELACEAKLSRYHFIRLFRQLTGLTPHQYVVRSRLLYAATRLLLEPSPILDVAFDSGFGDVSNFNHAFRAEFGVNPRTFRDKPSVPTIAASQVRTLARPL
jgi:AraC family transcriptional regulator